MAVKQRHINTSESRVLHLGEVLRSMVRGLITSRYMSYRICVKDIRTETSKSAFGLLWDFVDPFMLALVFYFLRRNGVFDVPDPVMPYSVFVIYGLLLYQTFSESVLMALTAPKRSKQILNHLNLPPEALLLSTLFRLCFNSIFRIVVMLAFSLALWKAAEADGFSSFSPVGFLKFLAGFPVIILIGMSIGVFLAPFAALYNDVERVVRIILTPLRYASPVLYPVATIFPFNHLYPWNPVALVLTDLRLLATTNTMEDPAGFFLRAGVFAAILLLGWFIFHVSMPILSERV